MYLLVSTVWGELAKLSRQYDQELSVVLKASKLVLCGPRRLLISVRFGSPVCYVSGFTGLEKMCQLVHAEFLCRRSST